MATARYGVTRSITRSLEPIDPDRVADGFGQKQDGGQGEAFYQSGKLTLTWLHHYFPSNPQAIAALFS